MPVLVVLRHGKSSYPPGVPDHERPLAARGAADAAAAGEWIRSAVGAPDHVVVSTARRARQTWALAADPLGYLGPGSHDAASPGPLTVDPRVYDAPAARLLAVVRELPARVGTAVLVGHSPGVEDLVHLLAGSAEPAAAALLAAKYPTSGAAVLRFDTGWPELDKDGAHLAAFAVPRG